MVASIHHPGFTPTEIKLAAGYNSGSPISLPLNLNPINFFIMADKKDIDFTYTTLDKIFRLSIGETADFSAAMYNGDFSMTVEEAQRKKHEFIAEQLHIQKGSKVLEMGSGWGPFLKFITEQKGANAMGLTLSDGQYNACIKKGFDVHIKDCRTVKPVDFGSFDAIVSVGAFEHFCSLEEYEAGNQEKVYRDFFKTVSDLLPTGGRFFLQTMTFTETMISPDKMDLNADKNSDGYILALTAKHLPGSWLPYGSEMITRGAEPYFKTINISSGRLDYIETIRIWRKKLRSFGIKKYGLYLNLLAHFLRNKKFRHLIDVFRISPIKVCFERNLMDHYRIVFEKL
jgi:cyclopropane-fatty-acyl-phospholipid synthase